MNLSGVECSTQLPNMDDQKSVRADIKRLPRLSAMVAYDIECNSNMYITMITFCIYNFLVGEYIDYLPFEMHEDSDYVVYVVKTIDDFWKALKLVHDESGVTKFYTMAYNGNKFDHLFLLNGDDVSQCKFDGTKLLYGSLNGGKFQVIFRDLRNYITTGNLADVGSQIGISKLDTKDKSSDVTYAVRDTVIVMHAAMRYLPDLLSTCIAVIFDTQYDYIAYSSLAHIAYSFVMKKALSYCDLYTMPKDCYDVFKQCYFGGIVHAPLTGEIRRDVSMLDVVSLYPAAMCRRMPAGKCSFHYKYQNWMADKLYICYAVLDNCGAVDPFKVYMPCLLRGKTTFLPYGRVRGYYTSVEIKTMCDMGATIVESSDYLVWCSTTDAFSIVYNEMFELKQNSSKGSMTYWFYKIMLNASIGRMSLPTAIPYINWMCMSYSRRIMYEHSCRILDCNGITAVCYMDTDSFVIPYRAYEDCKHLLGSKLGDLSLEIKRANFVCLGKKAYALFDNKYNTIKIQCKGHVLEQLSARKMIDVLLCGDVKTTRNTPTKTLSVHNDTLRFTITAFLPLTRTLNETTPEHMTYRDDICMYIHNKVITMYYMASILTFLREGSSSWSGCVVPSGTSVLSEYQCKCSPHVSRS